MAGSPVALHDHCTIALNCSHAQLLVALLILTVRHCKLAMSRLYAFEMQQAGVTVNPHEVSDLVVDLAPGCSLRSCDRSCMSAQSIGPEA